MNGEVDMRCTDEKLFRLCEDFAEHKEQFKRHEASEGEKFGQILEAQQQNTLAIGELTGQVSALVQDTRDIVQLHKDFQSVARVGNGVQNFALWCLKWGGILGGIGAGVHLIVEHFNNAPP